MPLVKTQFPSMLGGVVFVTLEREYYVELLRRPLSFACVTYFLAQEAQGVCMYACMCANACMSSGARDGLSTKIKAAKTYLHFGSACEFSCLRPSRRSPLRLSRNELSSTTAFGMFAGGITKDLQYESRVPVCGF